MDQLSLQALHRKMDNLQAMMTALLTGINEKYYSVSDFAAECGMTAKEVRTMCLNGHIPAFQPTDHASYKIPHTTFQFMKESANENLRGKLPPLKSRDEKIMKIKIPSCQ